MRTWEREQDTKKTINSHIIESDSGLEPGHAQWFNLEKRNKIYHYAINAIQNINTDVLTLPLAVATSRSG